MWERQIKLVLAIVFQILMVVIKVFSLEENIHEEINSFWQYSSALLVEKKRMKNEQFTSFSKHALFSIKYFPLIPTFFSIIAIL